MVHHLHIVQTVDKGVFIGVYATRAEADEVISNMNFPERYCVGNWYLELPEQN